MKKLITLLVILSLTVGITIGLSLDASASTQIPSWLKKTALWWGQGQVSDDEFIKAIQWLIDNKILSVSTEKTQNTSPSTSDSSQKSGFSDTMCTMNEYGNVVHMTGHYTNGPNSYSFLSLTLGVIDSSGKVVATGVANLDDVKPYQTRLFDAEAVYSGAFSKCEIEVGFSTP
jgi:hypothetical protein